MRVGVGAQITENYLLVQYMISEHGQVSGEDKMLAEMYARGPIACTIAVTKEFEDYTSGVFNDTTGAKVYVNP